MSFVAGHARLLHGPIRVLRVHPSENQAEGLPGSENRLARTAEATNLGGLAQDDVSVRTSRRSCLFQAAFA